MILSDLDLVNTDLDMEHSFMQGGSHSATSTMWSHQSLQNQYRNVTIPLAVIRFLPKVKPSYASAERDHHPHVIKDLT
jgi:hypothetical protein